MAPDTAVLARTRQLLDLSEGADCNARLEPIAALGLLLHSYPATQATAFDAGALTLLTATLRGTDNDLVHRVTLATMLLLVHNNRQTQDAAVRSGILVDLQNALDDERNSVTILSMMLMQMLVTDDQAHRATLLRPLCRVLREGYDAERAHAARILTAFFAGDEARTTAQLNATTSGAQLLPNPFDFVLKHRWDAPQFARSVLARCPGADDVAGDTRAALVRLIEELQHPDAPDQETLLVLEDLDQLIVDYPDLATTASALMATEVVPLCLTLLRRDSKCATSIILSLVSQNDAFRALTASSEEGSTDLLLQFLDEGVFSAVFVFTSLVSTRDTSATVVAAGALPLLVRVMCEGRREEAVAAAHVLGFLVREDTAAQAEAVDAGAMEALLALLRDTDCVGGANYVVQMQILVSVLHDFVHRSVTAQDAFMAAGGAAVMAQLIESREGGGAVAMAAVEAITFLVECNTLMQEAFTRAGVVDLLVNQLRSAPDSDAWGPASGLCALARGHAANKAAILRGANPYQLAELLWSRHVRAKFFVASIIDIVARGDDAARAQAVLADTGSIVPLVLLLSSFQETDVPLVAAMALGSLVRRNSTNQANAVSARAVSRLVRMLREPRPEYAFVAATTLAYVVDMEVEVVPDAQDDGEKVVENTTELTTVLVRLLGAAPLSSADKSSVALALADLVSKDVALRAVAVEAGAIEALAALAQDVDIECSSIELAVRLIQNGPAPPTDVLV